MAQLDPNEVSKVAQHLFKRFVKDREIPLDDVPGLDPRQFLGWLANSTISEFELSAALGVDQKACQFVMSMAHRPTGPNDIVALWPYLILANRVTRYPLMSMQLFLVLYWQDHTVVPLSIYLHKDIVDDELNDSAICSSVIQHSQNLLTEIMDKGLDAIHDDRQHDGLFGAPRTIQLAQDLVNGIVKREQVADSDMAAVNQLLAFVASMFPGDIPPEMRKQLLARAVDQAAPTESDGGFDNPG